MTPATCTRCGFTDDYPAKRGDRIKNMRCHACDRKGALARVKRTAEREGWAYATVLSGPSVRVVTDSAGGPPVGLRHMALDVYECAGREFDCTNKTANETGFCDACERALDM